MEKAGDHQSSVEVTTKVRVTVIYKKSQNALAKPCPLSLPTPDQSLQPKLAHCKQALPSPHGNPSLQDTAGFFLEAGQPQQRQGRGGGGGRESCKGAVDSFPT